MRTIGVVTVARSDYTPLRPVLKEICRHPKLRLALIAGGAHLSAQFGYTVREIRKDGFPVVARVSMLSSQDSRQGAARTLARGIAGFTRAFHRVRPDILLLLGDRLETFSAAAAATALLIPLAHIHGGEITEGQIDDALRHAITKMSHLHFVSHERHAERVIRMGEEPWRVSVTGAPGLDELLTDQSRDARILIKTLGFLPSAETLLATYHPVTLHTGSAKRDIEVLLSALAELRTPVLFTYPGADAEGRVILRAITAFSTGHRWAVCVPSLGAEAYRALMRRCRAMVGNSSSGLIEAPTFRLPVVNIGDRQKGRLRGSNVIDVPCERAAIIRAIRKAASPAFRDGLRNSINPYGDGRAGKRIVQILSRAPLGPRLLIKKFYEA